MFDLDHVDDVQPAAGDRRRGAVPVFAAVDRDQPVLRIFRGAHHDVAASSHAAQEHVSVRVGQDSLAAGGRDRQRRSAGLDIGLLPAVVVALDDDEPVRALHRDLIDRSGTVRQADPQIQAVVGTELLRRRLFRFGVPFFAFGVDQACEQQSEDQSDAQDLVQSLHVQTPCLLFSQR